MSGKRSSTMDYEAMTTTMEADPLQASQIDKARRTIASNAENADDAAELMKMLGIHPSQDDESGPSLLPSNLPNPTSKR